MVSEWREILLEELASDEPNALATGPFGSAISSKHFTDHGVPVIRGSNLSANISERLNDRDIVFLSCEKAKEFKRSIAKRGDLVFTCWGTINQVGFIDSRSRFDEYIVSNKQMKLTVNRGKVDPLFLYYLFSGPDKQAEILDNGIGSSVPGFNLGQLRKHSVLLPSLAEQRQIIEILGALDDKIAHLRETNATLEAIAQALFKSWFVDFEPVRAKAEGRDPEGVPPEVAELFPSEFEGSEPGVIPKGWAKSSLGEMTEVGIGKTPPRKEPHWFSTEPSDVRWVSIKDMGQPGVYISDSSEYLTQEAVDRFNVRVAPDNTILLSFKMTLGRLCITDGPMCTNEAIAHCKVPEGNNLTPEYVYCSLRAFNFSTLSSTSSIADAVNSKSVRAIPMLRPSPDVLRAFFALIGPIFTGIKLRQEKIRNLTDLRETLLPRLMSGKLRIQEMSTW